MTAIPLKVFLYGLIALVPGSDPDNSNHMTALLIDGRSPHDAHCAIVHQPLLQVDVDLASIPVCFSLGCKIDGRTCRCGKPVAPRTIFPLEGKEIFLDVKPLPELFDIDISHGRPAREVPEDSIEAESISYVVNLSLPQPGLILNDDFRVSKAPPSSLLARMIDIPFQRISACHLARIGDKAATNIHSLSLRKLGEPGQADDASQAMAQKVVAELTVDAATPVRVHIRDLSGAQDQVLTLASNDFGYQIDLSNDVEAPLTPDSLCDDGVARHFAYYYQLAANSPTRVEDFLIPHVRPTAWHGADGLEPPACPQPSHALTDHPICPMASFFLP